nr:allantoinase AllB [Micromonospora sp. ANENR4]
MVVRSDRVVTPTGERPAAVGVVGGTIAVITDRNARLAAIDEVDIGRDALLPGLVDSHVHVNEPGRTHWEGFETATAAAAAGGITTLLDMPLNALPPTTTAAALDRKRALARERCAIDVGFWGGAVPGNLGKLSDLVNAGAFGLKCFLVDSGVPEFPALTPRELAACMREVRALDSLLLVHAEDSSALRPGVDGPSYADFLASRPASAEVRAVALVARLAVQLGTRAHIVHLSAADAVPAIASARRAGAPLTVETCPHYLTLTAETIPDGATEFKCCPPIRDARQQEGLWEALARGTIDCIVSDHSPCPPAMKHTDTGNFNAAWGGIASLELTLALVWTQAQRRGFGLADVARWMADAPARIARIPGRGRIAEGYRADLVWFTPRERFTVDPRRLRQRHALTPYAGMTLTGLVRRTWLAGSAPGPGGGRLLTARAGVPAWPATGCQRRLNFDPSVPAEC